MMEQAACLRAMLAVTADMLVAARAREGDVLAELDVRYTRLSNALVTLPQVTPRSPDAVVIADLTRELLQRQEEIERLVRPWMDDMRVLFRERHTEKALAATYRQGD